MPDSNRHRVLVISRSPDLRNELVTLLSGYGYFVEWCSTRMEGLRKFRSHKQSIVIVDVPVLRTFPHRLFRFIRMIRRNAIVLIAANRKEEAEAVQRLDLGAYDILHLPLRTDFLKLTLNRAMEHHRLMLENIFVKNVVFFGLLLLPLWGLLGYLLVR
jgi:two-component system, NtrC family, response regulator HydG